MLLTCVEFDETDWPPVETSRVLTEEDCGVCLAGTLTADGAVDTSVETHSSVRHA